MNKCEKCIWYDRKEQERITKSKRLEFTADGFIYGVMAGAIIILILRMVGVV